MRISGIGPSIVTAVKIQQLTRRQPAVAQSPVASIRDVLDLSPAALRAAPGGARQWAPKVSNARLPSFLRAVISIARRL